MTCRGDLSGARRWVPLVLAAGLSLSAGAAAAYIGPDAEDPPYGWGLSELSQPLPLPAPATVIDVTTRQDGEAPVTDARD